MEPIDDLYKGREQTAAKHFILKRYLQALAFKVLYSRTELAYVDGFSGPWKSQAEDFRDTSFITAIEVLKDVQKFHRSRGHQAVIKCFLVEKDPDAYAQLEAITKPHDDPASGFYVKTFCGEFEDAIDIILEFVGKTTFALTFIDPTGWTGYNYGKVGPLLRHEPGEVVINMMYDWINRFKSDTRAHIEASFEGILGGPGWRERLDGSLPEGTAIVKMFHDELKNAGSYAYVVETKIDKTNADQVHYFIAYGTRSREGLKTFREVEWDALRKHEKDREDARLERKEAATGQSNLLSSDILPSSVKKLVEDQKEEAKTFLVDTFRQFNKPVDFDSLWPFLLQSYMLRVTNVKDICVDLFKEGIIKNTWKEKGKTKPDDGIQIIPTPKQSS